MESVFANREALFSVRLEVQDQMEETDRKIDLSYAERGYAVVPRFRTDRAIAELRERAEAIVEAFDPQTVSIFTTNDQTRTSDDYFLTSGDAVRCFFEEEAFDASGALCVPKAQAINKIGHAMHDLDPIFDAFSHGRDLAGVARAVGLFDPRLYQSMYIFKQPRIGGEVRWHQDATFFETDPITVTTFWFALEDATQENGCLWVEPGGHRTELRERFVVRDGVASMDGLSERAWPDATTAIPLEVEAGTLVVLHGLLPHYSAPNRSDRSRHAYTLHAVDARAHYSPRNWLQRPRAFPARSFLA